MKMGSEMVAHQALQTDLNRTRDLTGSRTRISSMMISSDSSGFWLGGLLLLLLLFLRPSSFCSSMAYRVHMQVGERWTRVNLA
jgi:hypothetical protein